jgi:hypothetical protein
MSNYTKQQIQYLTGGKTDYALLSSLRRAKYFENKKKEDESKIGNRLTGQYFPGEFKKAEAEGKFKIKENKADKIAGYTTLGVMKHNGTEWVPDETEQEIDFGGRIVKTHKGRIRALSSSLLKQSMDQLKEDTTFTNKLVKLFLTDPSGSICKYCLPEEFYEKLIGKASGGKDATPESITAMAPNTPEFADALKVLRNVTREAAQYIHMEDGWNILDQFDKDVSSMGAVGGGCCCK